MRPGRSSTSRRGIEGNDLDMVPMMNLFTVLVPILLLAAVFARVSVLDLALPPKGSGETGRSVHEEKSPLNLVVVVSREGITVGGTGGFLPSVTDRDEKLRFDAFALLLDRVRGEYPDESSVTVASDGGVAYEDVLKVMDICRDRGFREIALSALHDVRSSGGGEG